MRIGLWAEELTMPKRNMVAYYTCFVPPLQISVFLRTMCKGTHMCSKDSRFFHILNGKIARRMLLKSRVPGPCDAGSSGSGASWYPASCKIVELFAVFAPGR